MKQYNYMGKKNIIIIIIYREKNWWAIIAYDGVVRSRK